MIQELPVDIFATNQRSRSYQKLGIDYDTLMGLKPDIIWVGITGFGPDHDEAAYDPILQARAGFMELTGEPDGEPMVFGLPMVDLGADRLPLAYRGTGTALILGAGDLGMLIGFVALGEVIGTFGFDRTLIALAVTVLASAALFAAARRKAIFST